jgi:hypothetical protein
MSEQIKEFSINQEQVLKDIKKEISEEFKDYYLESDAREMTIGDMKLWSFKIKNKNNKAAGHNENFYVEKLDYLSVKKAFVDMIKRFKESEKAEEIVNGFNEELFEYQIEFRGTQEGFGDIKDVYTFTILKEEDGAIHGVTIDTEELDYKTVKTKIMDKVNQCRLEKGTQ